MMIDRRRPYSARPRLWLASLSVLALAAGQAAAQTAQPTPDPATVEAPAQSDPSPVVPAPDPATSDQDTPTPDPASPETAPSPAPPPAAPAVPPIPAVWAPVPKEADGATAYGLYLAGRNAMALNATDEGAGLLARAWRLTPEQPTLTEQAFTAQLLTGDLDVAAGMVEATETSPRVIAQAARLVAAVQMFVHDDARAADRALKDRPVGAPHMRAALFVQPWIAAAAGDWTTALAEPDAASIDIVSQLRRYQRAQILETARRYDEADAAYKVLVGGTTAQALFRSSYGAFLERRGRKAEALAVYDAAIAATPTDRQVQAAKARVNAGGRPPEVLTYKEGAASALVLAAAVASAEGADEFAAVYLRLSLNLHDDVGTRLTLASTLAKAGLTSAAKDEYARIPATEAEAYAAARVQIAAIDDRQGRAEDSLAGLRLAHDAQPQDVRIASLLAGQLIGQKMYDEALTLLNGPVLNTADQEAEVHFMRGAAYESLERVPEAEAELWAALQAKPDEPTYLNYLGYLWVDSGTRVDQGADLIAQAHARLPDDGNIQDSLGWSQYRRGQYDQAVTTLEEAVAKEPANAEINDHLGDAYWQVGRRREAGFQWNRVLTLDPDATRRAAVEKKLAEGLTPVQPVAGAR